VLREQVATIVAESTNPVEINEVVTEVVAVSPTATAADAELSVRVDPVGIAAFAAPFEPRTPMPNATTTPSAIRLKYVFVDILFLSLVVRETFSRTAGKEKSFAS